MPELSPKARNLINQYDSGPLAEKIVELDEELVDCEQEIHNLIRYIKAKEKLEDLPGDASSTEFESAFDEVAEALQALSKESRREIET